MPRIAAPKSERVTPQQRDASPVRKPSPVKEVPVAKPPSEPSPVLCPIHHMIKRRLGEEYVSTYVVDSPGPDALHYLISWEAWESRINFLWGRDDASSSYVAVLAYFIRRVVLAQEGIYELALLMDRFTSPFVAKPGRISDRTVDQIEKALRELDVPASKFTRSVLFALLHRCRWVQSAPSMDGVFLYHPVDERKTGLAALQYSSAALQSIWPMEGPPSDLVITDGTLVQFSLTRPK